VIESRIRVWDIRGTRLLKENKSVEGDMPEEDVFSKIKSLKGQDGVNFKRVMVTFGVP
jgi:hypothetical protein